MKRYLKNIFVCLCLCLAACQCVFASSLSNDSIQSGDNGGNIVGNVGEDEEDTSDDMIQLVPKMDEEGYLTVSVEIAEGTVLPITMEMQSDEGLYSLTIMMSGQDIRIKPGTYKITSVRDGDNKKLSSGATLTIDEDSDGIYLDFEKPSSGSDTIWDFIRTNILFIILVGVVAAVFYWYRKQEGF